MSFGRKEEYHKQGDMKTTVKRSEMRWNINLELT